MFKWSEKEYTLEDMAMCFRDLFPFPVLVRAGYLPGAGEEWSASTGDVYWAHTLVQNQFIIVQDKDKKRFKIPRSYKAMVIPIMADGKEGRAFPFHEVRDHGKYKYLRFVDNKRELVVDDSMERRCHVFGELEVIDVSEHDFIVLHPLKMEYVLSIPDMAKSEIVSETFYLVPMDVPLRVSVGVALDRASDIIFFHTMAELKVLVDSYGFSYQDRIKSVSVILYETKPKLDNEYEDVDFEEERNKHRQKDSLERSGALSPCIDPETRLRDLRQFYETGNMDSGGANLHELDCGEYLQPITWRAPVDNVNSSTDNLTAVQPGEVDDCPGKGVSQLKQYFEKLKSSKSDISLGSAQSSPSPVINKKNGTSQPATPPSGERRPVKTAKVSPLPKISAHTKGVVPCQMLPLCRIDTGPSQSLQNKQKACILRVQDIPDDISVLNVDQLMDCLKLLNLGDHIDMMRKGMVDGRLLLCLDEQNLINDFGFSTFSASKLMQFAKRGWRPKSWTSSVTP